MSLKLRTPSNANNPDSIITGYAPKLPRDAYRITFPKGEDRTKQSFKEECDINNIMARYVKTGVLEFAARHQPQYGDFTGYDFQTAQDTVAKGKTMFAELPAQIRERFENSPAKFLDFVSNPANEAEAVRLGLATACATPPAPATVPPAATDAPGAGGAPTDGGKGA